MSKNESNWWNGPGWYLRPGYESCHYFGEKYATSACGMAHHCAFAVRAEHLWKCGNCCRVLSVAAQDDLSIVVHAAEKRLTHAECGLASAKANINRERLARGRLAARIIDDEVSVRGEDGWLDNFGAPSNPSFRDAILTDDDRAAAEEWRKSQEDQP